MSRHPTTTRSRRRHARHGSHPRKVLAVVLLAATLSGCGALPPAAPPLPVAAPALHTATVVGLALQQAHRGARPVGLPLGQALLERRPVGVFRCTFSRDSRGLLRALGDCVAAPGSPTATAPLRALPTPVHGGRIMLCVEVAPRGPSACNVIVHRAPTAPLDLLAAVDLERLLDFAAHSHRALRTETTVTAAREAARRALAEPAATRIGGLDRLRSTLATIALPVVARTTPFDRQPAASVSRPVDATLWETVGTPATGSPRSDQLTAPTAVPHPGRATDRPLAPPRSDLIRLARRLRDLDPYDGHDVLAAAECALDANEASTARHLLRIHQAAVEREDPKTTAALRRRLAAAELPKAAPPR